MRKRVSGIRNAGLVVMDNIVDAAGSLSATLSFALGEISKATLTREVRIVSRESWH